MKTKTINDYYTLKTFSDFCGLEQEFRTTKETATLNFAGYAKSDISAKIGGDGILYITGENKKYGKLVNRVIARTTLSAKEVSMEYDNGLVIVRINPEKNSEEVSFT